MQDLANDNKRVNDLLISNKLQFEEHIRDVKNRSRDEEIKKAQYLTKSFEQKLKLVEDSKEGLNRKIQELVRLLQDKDTKLMDQERNYEDENGKLRQDITSMQEQVNQLNYIVNKLKSELS
jgi:flagellar capping protein FliD